MLTVTIDGTDRSDHVKTEISRRTVKVSLALGSQWQATLPVFDTDAMTGYRADTDESVLIEHSVAGPVFNGQITGVQEGPLDQESDQGVLQVLTALAATPIMEQIEDVTVTYPAGMTRKEVLVELQADYLAPFGITLDPALTDGDELPELAFDGVTPAAVLNAIQTITGEVWRLTPTLVLEMFLIGTKVAPFSLGEANAGSVTVNKTRSRYVNRVRLKAGPSSQLVKDEVITADGVADSWVMRYTPVSDGAGFIIARVVHEDDGVTPFHATLSPPGQGGMYEFDPATNTLTRMAGVPAAGTIITFTPTVQFPISVTVEDAADIALHGLWSKNFVDANITDIDTAEETAAGLLATGLVQPRVVSLITDEGFVLPGTTIPLTFPKRLISGDHVVLKVDVADFEADLLEYTYTLQSGDRAQGSFTDTLRSKLGQSVSGAVTVTGGGTVITTVLSSPIELGGTDMGSFTAPDWTRPFNVKPFFAKSSFTARLRVELWARESGAGVTARLWNVTDDVSAGQTSQITNQARTATSVLVPILANKEYLLQAKVTAGSGGAYLNAGQLEAA